MSAGRNTISPMSDIESRNRRALAAGSKRARRFTASSKLCRPRSMGPASAKATGVGCMPAGVRMNSGSSNCSRSRASA